MFDAFVVGGSVGLPLSRWSLTVGVAAVVICELRARRDQNRSKPAATNVVKLAVV